MTKTRIAVYGSLLSGLGNHQVLGRHLQSGDAELIGTTKIKGFKLFPVAGRSFPGINRGTESDRVVVELYDVKPNALANVRSLEGYTPGGSNYFYDEVDAVTEEGDVARAYLYVDIVGDRLTEVPNGDWRAYVKLK